MLTFLIVVAALLFGLIFLMMAALQNNYNSLMATLQEIQDQNQKLVDAVAAEDTVIAGAVTLISGFGATLTDIRAQLAEAQASHDPAVLQIVADSITATIADIQAKTDALSSAVVANTPAA